MRTVVCALLGATAAVVAIAVLVPPSVPHEFLEGASYRGTSVSSVAARSSWGTRTSTSRATRQYWLDRPLDETRIAIVAELTPTKGWSIRSLDEESGGGTMYKTLPPNDLVTFYPEGEGTWIHISGEATPVDRVLAWIWSATHR